MTVALKTQAQVLLVGLFGLTLTACGPKEVPVFTLPPAELAVCADEPNAPDLPPLSAENQRIRDEMVLEYILDLRSAYGDCAAKVMGLKVWRDTAGG